MSVVEVLVLLVAACVGLALLARLVHIPPAVALVFGGMALALVPDMPRLDFDPHIALALFLPPLLQVSAFRTDWDAFQQELRPIMLLALGAVLFTAGCIAVTVRLLEPSLPWAACIALGAIVAPPDAVAATAVLKAVRIPRRLTTILEGESLLNDASSLILYRFAVSATVVASISFREAGIAFVLSSLGGAAIGWAVGRAVMALIRALDDTLLEMAAIVLAGFVGYMAAEYFELSGVLAAVACGLVIGRSQHQVLSARTRVDSAAIWSFLEFLLTSLVFILIGLQLRDVVSRLGDNLLPVLLIAAGVSAVLVLSRFVWVFASSAFAYVLPARFRLRHASMPTRFLVVISWAGMRGVVSLAAALALPTGFPGRDLIIFIAFCAILVTLVLQGTTLGWVIRKLGVVEISEQSAAAEEARIRQAGAEAALDVVERRLFEGRVLGLPDTDMLREYRRRAASARLMAEDSGFAARRSAARIRLELEAVQVARDAVLEHARHVDGEVLQLIVEELDFEEGRLDRALGHAPA